MESSPIATRLFDVECLCGGEFRIALEVGAAVPAADGFLAPPSGQCPHCGLRLEEIEPFRNVQ
jgi:hypothetical protein